MEPELKPRGMRVGEVAWDLMPIVASFGWVLLFGGTFLFPPGTLEDFLFKLVMLGLAIPFANALWMQISAFGLIRRMTQKEWRESLYLSEIKSRPYLISQLEFRAKLQAIPFMCGLLCCMLMGSVGFHLMMEQGWRAPGITLGLGVLFALVALQFCGVFAGFLGHLNRIRYLCKPHTAEASLIHLSAKWIGIILLTPAALLVSLWIVVDVLVLNAVEFDESLVLRVLSIHLIVACSALSFLFRWLLRRSWLKTQDEFYKFE